MKGLPIWFIVILCAADKACTEVMPGIIVICGVGLRRLAILSELSYKEGSPQIRSPTDLTDYFKSF